MTLNATMPDGLYRNKDSTAWENLLYLHAKAKASCCLEVSRHIKTCKYITI